MNLTREHAQSTSTGNVAKEWRTRPSDDWIGLAADQVRKQGYIVLHDVFSEEEITEASNFAEAQAAQSGQEYVSLVIGENLPGFILGKMACSEWFSDLNSRLYGSLTNLSSPDVDVYAILRCLIGQSGQDQSLYYHYDSYLLTAIAPVVMPTGENSGDLLLFANSRPVRRSYVINMLEKAVLDRNVIQRVITFIGDRWRPPTRIHMTPGNLYIILGYRSLHTNEPSDPDRLRATAVFHCFNPHQTDRSKRLLDRLRRPS